MSLYELDLRPGLGVQPVIQEKYGLLVLVPAGPSLGDFVLVVSFGRCKFRLTEESVGNILQATIGGLAANFRPVQLADRVFGFSVTAKVVGIHIYNLRSYDCAQYKLFFHLLGEGGASWTKELDQFQIDEESSWTTIQRKSKPSYRDALAGVKLTGANNVPIRPLRISVFDRIQLQRSLIFNRLQRPDSRSSLEMVKNTGVVQNSNSFRRGSANQNGPAQSLAHMN